VDIPPIQDSNLQEAHEIWDLKIEEHVRWRLAQESHIPI
jgi:hypothetical protein